jgi:hypothetical protein
VRLLGLTEALGDRRGVPFCLDDAEFVVPVDQHVVRDILLRPCAGALESTKRDPMFTADAATVDHAPARGLEGRVDEFGSGFGFIHGSTSQ